MTIVKNVPTATLAVLSAAALFVLMSALSAPQRAYADEPPPPMCAPGEVFVRGWAQDGMADDAARIEGSDRPLERRWALKCTPAGTYHLPPPLPTNQARP
jgi:hypothetical protein